MGFLDPADFADLRAEVEEGFDHTVVPVNHARVRQPNGQYERIPVEGEEIPGALVVASSRVIEEAAAKRIAVTWVLKLPLGDPLPPAEFYRVSGVTAGVEWVERVKVTGHLKGDRVNQRLAVVGA